MNKVVISLLAVLVVLVATHGFLVWRLGERTHTDAQHQRCIQRIEATAMIGLLTPASRVDPRDACGRSARWARTWTPADPARDRVRIREHPEHGRPGRKPPTAGRVLQLIKRRRP
jgi:hypothetical protein